MPWHTTIQSKHQHTWTVTHFLAVLLELSPNMFDSNAFSFIKYKVMKTTVALLLFQSSQATKIIRRGWYIKLKKAFLTGWDAISEQILCIPTI